MGDVAAAIAAETAFSVELTRHERMIIDRYEYVALAGGMTDEGVSHPRDSHKMIRPAIESIFTDILVQQTNSDASGEFG